MTPNSTLQDNLRSLRPSISWKMPFQPPNTPLATGAAISSAIRNLSPAKSRFIDRRIRVHALGQTRDRAALSGDLQTIRARLDNHHRQHRFKGLAAHLPGDATLTSALLDRPASRSTCPHRRRQLPQRQAQIIPTTLPPILLKPVHLSSVKSLRFHAGARNRSGKVHILSRKPSST
jgi:hypothetical protein